MKHLSPENKAQIQLFFFCPNIGLIHRIPLLPQKGEENKNWQSTGIPHTTNSVLLNVQRKLLDLNGVIFNHADHRISRGTKSSHDIFIYASEGQASRGYIKLESHNQAEIMLERLPASRSQNVCASIMSYRPLLHNNGWETKLLKPASPRRSGVLCLFNSLIS